VRHKERDQTTSFNLLQLFGVCWGWGGGGGVDFVMIKIEMSKLSQRTYQHHLDTKNNFSAELKVTCTFKRAYGIK